MSWCTGGSVSIIINVCYQFKPTIRVLSPFGPVAKTHLYLLCAWITSRSHSVFNVLFIKRLGKKSHVYAIKNNGHWGSVTHLEFKMTERCKTFYTLPIGMNGNRRKTFSNSAITELGHCLRELGIMRLCFTLPLADAIAPLNLMCFNGMTVLCSPWIVKK